MRVLFVTACIDERKFNSGTYLEHFLDTFGRHGAILGDVGTEDVVGVWVRLAVLPRLVVPQLFEDCLGHISVQVVDEDVL